MIKKRLNCLLSLALVCVVGFSGCKTEEKSSLDNSPTPSITVTDMVNKQTENMEITNMPNLESTVTQLNSVKELSIYSIDADTAQKISIIAVVASDVEITPQLIVDKVVDSMADETFMIGIDSVTTKDDKVIVSFLDDQPPVTNVGSSVEGEILDAIAMSLVDNLADYHKVIFQVMGEAYASGHMEFDKDYVYLESNE